MAEPLQDQPEKFEPLWQSVVGEKEPWRRGRLFLILLAVVSFGLQCLAVAARVALGDIERLLLTGMFLLIFWLQFYFIWIGVHWVRWIYGGWNTVAGFALIILGWRDHATIAVFVGFYLFGVGVYLALAPSVYFFAKRQRETIRWVESIIVACVFLLLLASFVAGVLGLIAYRTKLEQDAHQFADSAFGSIFAEHDTYFMLDHVSRHLMETGGGRDGLTRFLQFTTLRAGDVKDIRPSVGPVQLWFALPLRLGARGEMTTQGNGEHGRIRMEMTVSEMDGDWEIDAVHWAPIAFNPPPRR